MMSTLLEQADTAEEAGIRRFRQLRDLWQLIAEAAARADAQRRLEMALRHGPAGSARQPAG